MKEIKVFLEQNSQQVSAQVKRAEQTIGVNISSGIVGTVYHDDTLVGAGTNYDPLGISQEIIKKIENANTFIYEQAEASKTWNIQHGLGKYPSVTVVDSANNVVMGGVQYVDENNLIVTFNGAFKGMAYLN